MMTRTELIESYRVHCRNRTAGPTDNPPASVVAGYCLQYPAPLQVLDNLRLPFGSNREGARALIQKAGAP